MAVYGVDFYGTAAYGSMVAVEFSVEPFTVKAYSTTSLLLNWFLPGGQWDRMQLVRSVFGHPLDSGEGEILFDVAKEVAPITYQDTTLPNGQIYYYTIFVRSSATQKWVRAGVTAGLVARQYGSTERMWELLPEIYRRRDEEMSKGSLSLRLPDKGPLYRFLDIFGYQLDHIRNEYETLLDTYDIEQISGGLLPLLSHQLGIPYEPELGMTRTRVILRAAARIHRIKGTRPGIEAYVEALTGWSTRVTVGPNLMLDQNQSSFLESIGTWVALGNVSLVERVTTPTPAIEYSPMLMGGVLSFTASGASPAVASTTTQEAPRHGVPVVAGRIYLASAYVRSGSVSRSMRIEISFVNESGSVVGAAVTGDLVAAPNGDWVRVTVSSVAPAGARFVQVVVRATGALVGEKFLVSNVAIERNSVVSAWTPARELLIKVLADRVNLVKNPSFEVNTTSWSTGTRTAVEARFGGFSLEMATGTTTTTPTGKNGIVIVPENTFALSAYTKGIATVVMRLRYYDTGGVFLASYETTVDSINIEWKRGFLLAYAPPDAYYAAVEFSADAAVKIDGVLLERAVVLNDYFDPSLFSSNADYLWQGTPHESASHYYSRRTIKNYRATETLPRYVPGGSSFRLVYLTEPFARPLSTIHYPGETVFPGEDMFPA